MQKKILISVVIGIIPLVLYLGNNAFKEGLDPKFLIYYYALLIFIGAPVIVIAWLLITMRRFKEGADERLESKVRGSEKLLKILGLDMPDRKPPAQNGFTTTNDLEINDHPDPLMSRIKIKDRMKRIQDTYANVKELLDLKLFLNETKVKDVMSAKIVSIEADEPFVKVPKKFEEFNIRHLPVVDHNNKLVGLVTQRDLYRICSPRKLIDGELHYDDEMLNHFILEKVMVKNPVSMSPDNRLGEAVVKMVYSGYGCLPIVDHTKTLVGFLTRGDILKLVSMVYLSSS